MNPSSSPGSVSREKVRCIHCNSALERKNIKSHTFGVHAGQSPEEVFSGEKPSSLLSFSICLTELPLPNNFVGQIKFE